MKKTTQIFKALSDDTRLRILGLLVQGELCVCDLVAVLDLPQSTVSRHLAYLRNSGLVDGRRQGVWMHYRLAQQDGALHDDLIDLLSKDLARLEEIKSDQRKLRQYLSKKRTVKCC